MILWEKIDMKTRSHQLMKINQYLRVGLGVMKSRE